MLRVHKATLALGLFLLGLGVSLFAVGGAGIATAEITKGDLRRVRPLLFFVIAGLAAMAIGSIMAAFSLEQKATTGSDVART